MGLAERFGSMNTNSGDVLYGNINFGTANQYESANSFDYKLRYSSLKEKLFEKIVSIPCWFEYSFEEQNKLINKFLEGQGIKNPSMVANYLQHQTWGFGVFDDYLQRVGVTSVLYETNSPVIYTQDDKTLMDEVFLPEKKVKLAVQNIINMSQNPFKSDAYDFRVSDYWVQLRILEEGFIKLNINKINVKFLAEEINKAGFSSLLTDLK